MSAVTFDTLALTAALRELLAAFVPLHQEDYAIRDRAREVLRQIKGETSDAGH